MFRSIIFAILTVAGAAAASAQTDSTKVKLRDEIGKLDLAHAQAILNKNTAALRTLIADDATTNHPTNKIVKERDGILELIRNGTINYASFERVQDEFLFFKNTVIVMGHETLTMADSGATVKRRYTNFWMKRDGRWKLVVRHAHVLCGI